MTIFVKKKMKKLITVVLAMIFPILLIGDPTATEDYVYTQYSIFERERGSKSLEAAQTIMDTIGDVLGEKYSLDANSDKETTKATLLKSLMIYYSITSEFDKVFIYGEIAIPFYRERGDLMELAGCYHTMGISAQYLGHFDEAIHYYQLCNEVMDEIGGPMAARNQRYEINNMASIYLMMEDCDQAEKMYYTCIDLLGDVGTDTLANRDLAAYYQNLVGVWLMKISKMDPNDEARTDLINKSVEYAQQSLTLSKRYNDFDDKKALRQITLSKAFFEAGLHNEALAETDSAMVIAQELGLISMEMSICALKGDYAYRMGQYDNAEKYYLQAASMAKEHHFDEPLAEILNGAYLSTKKNHPERSIEYLEQCKALEDSIYSQEKRAMIHEYQVKYQTAEKERELLLQQAKNEQNRHRMIWLTIVVLLLIALAIVLIYLTIQKRKQNEALKQRDRFKNHLFSVISHDIKAPLEGQAQLLDMACEHFDNMQPEELKESLQAMKTSADNLKDKVMNVIYWVKGKMGDTENHPTSFNLNEIAQGSTRDLVAQASMKNLTVVNKIPTDWMGFDDINLIKMVMQNLLSNAIKYSWNDSEITITATDNGKQYWIAVADKGLGIKKEKLDKLLKELSMSDSGTKGEMGTGIGLYVSNQLMQRLGGKIVIESNENIGTVVSFSVNKS